MRVGKLRIYAAGLLAFLIGVPLTEKAFGQAEDIFSYSVGLAQAIAASAGGS